MKAFSKVAARNGLGPHQLAWCRANIPHFAEMETITARVREETWQARLNIAQAQNVNGNPLSQGQYANPLLPKLRQTDE